MGTATAGSARSAVLRVPAATDALSLVRLFAASVGRELDLPSEVIDDLRLGLTEVCSAAIEASDDGVLTITLSWSESSALDVAVASSSSFSTEDPASDRSRLLEALGLVLLATAEGHAVRFSVPRSPL